MSLVLGYEKPSPNATVTPPPAPESVVGTVKIFSKTLTFDQLHINIPVKIFTTGILLSGISTTTGSDVPSHAITGILYYDFYDETNSLRFQDIRPTTGNSFPIVNGANSKDGITALLGTYNTPKPCTVLARLGLANDVNNRSINLKTNPVSIRITLYYTEIPVTAPPSRIQARNVK